MRSSTSWTNGAHRMQAIPKELGASMRAIHLLQLDPHHAIHPRRSARTICSWRPRIGDRRYSPSVPDQLDRGHLPIRLPGMRQLRQHFGFKNPMQVRLHASDQALRSALLFRQSTPSGLRRFAAGLLQPHVGGRTYHFPFSHRERLS